MLKPSRKYSTPMRPPSTGVARLRRAPWVAPVCLKAYVMSSCAAEANSPTPAIAPTSGSVGGAQCIAIGHATAAMPNIDCDQKMLVELSVSRQRVMATTEKAAQMPPVSAIRSPGATRKSRTSNRTAIPTTASPTIATCAGRIRSPRIGTANTAAQMT